MSYVSLELTAKAIFCFLLEDKVYANTFLVLAFLVAFAFITSLKKQERKRDI
jgi:hypothetical protein